jgi:RimJ/RimL family protein N-acetyltransferase
MTDPDFLAVPPMLVVETERLRLRTARVADAAAIMPIITDETTMKFTSGVVANDLGVAERWLSARALGADVFNFVITLKEEGDGSSGPGPGSGPGDEEQIIGILGSSHLPEIGYLMNPGMSRKPRLLGCSLLGWKSRIHVLTTKPTAYAGKGYATEALRAYLPVYFERVPSPTASGVIALGFDYVQAETDNENFASQRILLKCGFELVETLTNAFDSPSLGLRDTLIYKLARPGMSLESLGQVERPVRLLEMMGRGGRGGHGHGEVEEGFVPPVQ